MVGIVLAGYIPKRPEDRILITYRLFGYIADFYVFLFGVTMAGNVEDNVTDMYASLRSNVSMLGQILGEDRKSVV